MSTQFSATFTKELALFNNWAQSKVVSDFIWGQTPIEFTEPARNRLLKFLDAVVAAQFKFQMDGQDVTDNKNVVEAFKKRDKKLTDPKSTRKSPVKKPAVVLEECKIDFTTDTTDTEYVETLEFFTEELKKALGEPQITGLKPTEDEEHEYEWKGSINGTPFSIYDWKYQGEDKEILEERTWFLATQDKSFKAPVLEYLTKLIESK